jgi:phosphatidylglycerophosphatase A
VELTDRACRALATGLYSSLIPAKLLGRFSKNKKWTGAGFVGTLVGAAMLPLVPLGGWRLAAFLAASVVVSSEISRRAERSFGTHDDPRIVIDEIVGYWVAAAWLPRETAWLAAAFVLFRIFDSWKPAPFAMFERLPHGYGVVMDDVAAGVAANLALQACYRFC